MLEYKNASAFLAFFWAVAGCSQSEGSPNNTYCSRTKGPLTAAEATSVSDAEMCPAPATCFYEMAATGALLAPEVGDAGAGIDM